jgi:hypothetical protein
MSSICSFDVGTRHLCFCIINKETEQIEAWENIDLGQDYPTETLIVELQKFPQIWDCETILIERQPALNPKMKSFSNEMKMFLTIRKIDYKKNCDIRFYSSKYKVDFFEKDFEFPIEIYNTKNGKKMSNYMKTKKEGLYLMTHFVSNQQNPDTTTFYLGNTQMCKRDLADSFLQGLSFIRRIKHKKSTITARKPSTRQKKYKKFSKSNLKYIWKIEYNNNENVFDDFINDYGESIKREYGFNYEIEQVKMEILT